MGIVKIDGIEWDNVVKVSGIAKSSIAKVVGCTVPSVGATKLVACFDDAYVSYVPIADEGAVADWENNMYQARNGDNWDITDIAVGKDGNGDEFYVAVVNSNNPEIIHDDDGDITDGQQWTEINLGTGGLSGNLKQRTVLWGNDVWVSAGMLGSSDKYIYRSTDGSSWSAVDISGLPDIGDVYSNGIYALTSDGDSNWWFGVGEKIYKSTNNASAWALEHTLSGTIIQDLVYTNDTVVALVNDTGGSVAAMASAAALDTKDWSGLMQLSDSSGATMHQSRTKRMAGGDGRVVCIDWNNTLAVNVDGKTIAVTGSRADPGEEGNLNCICTDGGGNWWVGADGGSTAADGGDICKSEDNGLSWTRTVEGINKSGDRKVEGIATDVYLPV